MTTTDDNKRLYRAVIEDCFNAGELDKLDEYVADDFVLHEANWPEPIRGPEGFEEFLQTYRTAFPEAHVEIDEIVAEGDLVVARWTATGTHDGDLMGIEPTGESVTLSGIEMCRIEDGKFVEDWEVMNLFRMLQQLHVLPEDVTAAMSAADD